MTTEQEQLVKYFTLEQLETVNKEFVDVLEDMKEIINLPIPKDVKWQLIVREVNHNNNYNFFNADQVRCLNNEGYTDELDIICGDYKNTGVEIIVTIREIQLYDQNNVETGKDLHFGKFFDINLKGEDYTFEGNTIEDLDGAITELQRIKAQGMEVNGTVKSINTMFDNRSFRIDVDEEFGTVSIYRIYENQDDMIISKTSLYTGGVEI